MTQGDQNFRGIAIGHVHAALPEMFSPGTRNESFTKFVVAIEAFGN
jgi:hypothetical protein